MNVSGVINNVSTGIIINFNDYTGDKILAYNGKSDGSMSVTAALTALNIQAELETMVSTIQDANATDNIRNVQISYTIVDGTIIEIRLENIVATNWFYAVGNGATLWYSITPFLCVPSDGEGGFLTSRVIQYGHLPLLYSPQPAV